jgi:twitching motility two-component system response regulator PilH
MKILLVDDSKTVCAIYEGLLKASGYSVLVATSMAEALELAEEHRPPLAIVDYYMPISLPNSPAQHKVLDTSRLT